MVRRLGVEYQSSWIECLAPLNHVLHLIALIFAIGFCVAVLIDFALSVKKWDWGDERIARILAVVLLAIYAFLNSAKRRPGEDYMERWRAQKKSEKDASRDRFILSMGLLAGYFIHYWWFV